MPLARFTVPMNGWRDERRGKRRRVLDDYSGGWSSVGWGRDENMGGSARAPSHAAASPKPIR